MLLHCVRSAAHGGCSTLMDHEMAYVALRDADPDWVRALMAPDAMTIPAREDEDGVARAEQRGPVFSVDACDGSLHMRYTARTRSIVWKDDAATHSAVAFLRELLHTDAANVLRVRLEPGMGLVCNNVLHGRSAFVDDPAHPRLLYRARYLDRIAAPETDLFEPAQTNFAVARPGEVGAALAEPFSAARASLPSAPGPQPA